MCDAAQAIGPATLARIVEFVAAHSEEPLKEKAHAV
jgi:hypothetical protein